MPPYCEATLASSINLGVVAGGIDQCRGNTKSAVLHGLRNETLHFSHFGGCRCAIDIAQNRFANLSGADVGADVQRCAGFFKALEVAVEGGPIHF